VLANCGETLRLQRRVARHISFSHRLGSMGARVFVEVAVGYSTPGFKKAFNFFCPASTISLD
jgi:hypothetical protein